MTFNERYNRGIERAGSRLCVGLDTDRSWIPAHLADEANPILAFNRAIIEATSDLCLSYKMNMAFYESEGRLGLDALEGTLDAIPEGCLTIGDAKRGDIGNTANHYARSLFEVWNFDSITVNPYMGTDTIAPYMEYPGRGVFVLALTSNSGSSQFQHVDDRGEPLYMTVIDQCRSEFADADQIGFVVGATHPAELEGIRQRVGMDVPLLIPGIGTQGGDVEGTVKANNGGIAFINISRGISKAGSGEDFTEKAREAALSFRDQLAEFDPDERIVRSATEDAS